MNKRETIINIAKADLGYKEGKNNDTKYGNWYGLPNQPWCAMAVSKWIYDAGVNESIVPRFASCTIGWNKFKQMGITKNKDYTPQVGDIIFIDWDPENGNGVDHVGIVEYVENTTVHMIEGNRSDMVGRWNYPIGSNNIWGYAVPNYVETSGNSNNNQEDEKEVIRGLQQALNQSYGAGLAVDGIVGEKTKSVLRNKVALKNYSENEVVRWVQNRLVYHKGYNVGASAIDGKYGKDTETAVKDFQRDNKIKIDGIAGIDTISLLV